jgi:hypothetical protein
MSERNIAKQLDIPRSTVNLDVRTIRRKALADIETFEERIPFEYESTLTGLRLLLKWAWDVLENEESSEKMIIHASHIILSCYQEKRALEIDKSNIQEAFEYRQRRYPPKPSFEDKARIEAQEKDWFRRQAVF